MTLDHRIQETPKSTDISNDSPVPALDFGKIMGGNLNPFKGLPETSKSSDLLPDFKIAQGATLWDNPTTIHASPQEISQFKGNAEKVLKFLDGAGNTFTDSQVDQLIKTINESPTVSLDLGVSATYSLSSDEKTLMRTRNLVPIDVKVVYPGDGNLQLIPENGKFRLFTEGTTADGKKVLVRLDEVLEKGLKAN